MSKKFLVAFATLVMTLCLFAFAQAEVKQFTNFKAEVPAGWNSMEQQGAVMIMAPDGSSAVTITMVPHGGMSAEDVAKQASQALSGSAPEKDGDGWSFTYNVAGVEGRNYVKTKGDNLISIAVVGNSSELEKILDSIE